MSIREERLELLRRIKKEGKGDLKALSRKIRIPYSTFLVLAGGAKGTITSWEKIERYFERKDKIPVPPL